MTERTGREQVVRVVRELVREEADELRHELLRPWRGGGSGAAARAGRWLGLGLALGVAVAGVTAAFWAHRRR